ncbi:CRISPR-associated helicase Cas3' [Candidatus Uabimicrobium sp. HlEnr_7]|uniref:CRISPR-associated helicase Cas3' n=1 Tax=Candidatus Uabimicrobium helgolandensis TaxID=3095367 RepID=UPI0035562C47
MSSSNIYSHPGKLLCVHLEKVADACLNKFQKTQHCLDKYASQEIWEKLIWIMGFSHDLGKGTNYFQTYLLSTNAKERKQLKGPLTSHALISAVLAHWMVKQLVAHLENDLSEILPLFIYLAIKKHHGNINNAMPTRHNDSDELNIPIEHLDKQLQSFELKELQLLFDMINDKHSCDFKAQLLPESLVLYFNKNLLRQAKKRFKKAIKTTDYYLMFLYLYSLLLHSDKEDVVFGRSIYSSPIALPVDIVDEYKRGKFASSSSSMDTMREEIYKEALQTAVNSTHKIFSLNVPTGTGKTLTSLAVALQLREKLHAQGLSPKIIYGLPFTSIIDQNYQVFNDLLGNPSSDVLLKHHHLAEVSYKITDLEAEFETGESKFMMESWQSEIVVTTFYQIFHTLFTNRNRMIQKFHNLANSIILLDEIQAVPYKYWELLREIILKFSQLFHVHFVLITATQPKIFADHEITELVANKKVYFDKLDRINLQFHSQKVTLDEFTELCQQAVENSSESFLFIMNTINSSLELFKHLQSCEFDAEYFYLATNIIPKHRLQRIHQIKTCKSRKIIVSTQMVEAGVDFDIENVWRDFGPLESINQVCGRCNRNSSEKKGNVRIFEIVDEARNNKPYAHYVYGRTPLSLIETKNVLGGNDKITEKEFLKNMDSYYQKLEQKMAKDTSLNIIECMQNLQFEDVNSSFRLIDAQGYEKKDIFIELDSNAQKIWEKFVSLQEEENRFERRIKFLKFKKEFFDYVISVPKKYVPEEEYPNSWVVYIPNEGIEESYDEATGWKRDDSNYIW